MAFHKRKYEVYLILGNPKKTPLWHWSEWCNAAALFQPLVMTPRGAATLRVFQTGSGIPRFGRLTWNDESHMKWTHSSPVTGKNSRRWAFVKMEAWSPSWNVCEAEDRAPDFYFQLFNAKQHEPKKPRFNPIIICAVGVSMKPSYLSQFRQAAKKLAKQVESRLFVYKERPWALDSDLGGGIFEEAIMDLPLEGTLFRGNPHAGPTNIRILAEKWKPVK